MMGNINIIGEHLANQIFHQINHVAKDETVRKVIALIGRDESRHIAAGQRFFGEVYPEFKKRRSQILVEEPGHHLHPRVRDLRAREPDARSSRSTSIRS